MAPKRNMTRKERGRKYRAAAAAAEAATPEAAEAEAADQTADDQPTKKTNAACSVSPNTLVSCVLLFVSPSTH